MHYSNLQLQMLNAIRILLLHMYNALPGQERLQLLCVLIHTTDGHATTLDNNIQSPTLISI
jgi:hypothetical protein